jgi:type I restriction enzyme M protein
MKISQWIRDRRAAAGLTQVDLAEKTGVTPSIVSQWERGIAKPSAMALPKLRALFGEPGTAVPSPAAAPSPPPEPPPVDPAAAPIRPPRAGRRSREAGHGAAPETTRSLEAKLWQTADALRNNMDAAEYKHVVLGLIFLKYISDAFEAQHAALEAQRADGADPEDPDEYRAANIFWVPKEARWPHLRALAPQPSIGSVVDDAMSAIERDNRSLQGVLPKDYARPGLDKQRLGQLINLVSDIGLGRPADRAKDVLGGVYEYFLAQFASAEGKKGGQFYTPSHVVRVLVEMLAPYKGRVYDPCCGSGGMFVSSEKFIEAHSGKIDDLSIYGQESNYTTWRLAKMNLAIRGIDAQIAHGDTSIMTSIRI